MPNSRSSVGSQGSPPLATDVVALPGSEVPLLGLLSGGRCFGRLANEPGGPSRNILRPAVSRASAGSAQSLTRSRSSSCAAAVGLADAIARSLSLTSVFLLGVARLRPPRRSPGFEPRGIAVYLRPSSAGGPLRMSRALPSGRIPAHPRAWSLTDLAHPRRSGFRGALQCQPTYNSDSRTIIRGPSVAVRATQLKLTAASVAYDSLSSHHPVCVGRQFCLAPTSAVCRSAA